MTTERWQRLEQVFTDAAQRPEAAREDFLAGACGSDGGLRDEVAALLTAMDASGEFLAAPALEAFARQVSREGWSVQPGDRIGVYTVVRRLGVGGVGEVWRARDERLARDVAIKLLLPYPAGAAERMHALQQEARAAGTLNHTNVLTVYDVGDHGGAAYLVTECLEGESLRACLSASALSVEAALDIALQVARGLAAAHERGIVHRDLKPENVFLALDGRVKILDFGLATLRDPARLPATGASVETARALVAGTAGYMAPEQVRGEELDGRADIFALGAVLYEMLAGRPAFKEQGTLATLDAALTREAPDPTHVNPAVSPALSQLVRRCLAKPPDERYATAADVVRALDGLVRARGWPPRLLAFVRRPLGMATLACVLLASVAFGWHWHVAAGRARWARLVAAPEARRLWNRGNYADAFMLAREAVELVPDDPQLRQLWIDVSMPVAVVSEPAGAEVALARYGAAPVRWMSLGRTPLDGVRVPRSLFRLRLSKPGFQPLEGSAAPGALPRYRLDPLDAVPAGMVRVLGTLAPVRYGLDGALDDYWLDRFEVTNRQYKEFVDQGGYRRHELWREPFTDGARSLSWDEALARFRDSTGKPGPATWASGTYRDGQADFPVGGVSWYEAAAYAAFAGKSLPTVRHWYRAVGLGRYDDLLTVSNLGGKGLAAVGTYAGLGPFGTYDMAGNVKEWCSTAMRTRRFLLGGAWNEPRYLFADYDAREPFDREPAYGFRLAKYIEPLSPELRAPVEIEGLDRGAHLPPPVGDEIFEVYRRQYAYDHTPLAAVVEATETTESGSRQTIAFDTAYGGERMRAHLFLPKNASPPYQTVLMFPGAGTFALRSSRDMSTAGSAFILRSGRAVLYPVYKGMYERSTTDDDLGPAGEREVRTMWARDLGRAIDYLETRKDIDVTRLAFYGVSAGADAGVILTAIEPRLKASVLQATGIGDVVAPEIDPVNYAPRVRLPTLLLNGRYDFDLPVETAQRPLFALLGTPAEHKRHVVLESGHAMPLDAVAREILPWLDRYLGEVGCRGDECGGEGSGVD